jgi:DNA invertase Pin-like site-specific DNA recombinase
MMTNNRSNVKIGTEHLDRKAYVYVRQSSLHQVENHLESQRRQYEFAEHAVALGWPRERIVVIDEDQGKSGARAGSRHGFGRLVTAVGIGEV